MRSVPRGTPVVPVSGLVLAAGAGRRFGGPKALARTPGGRAWLALAVEALYAGGCRDVVVALGAAADEASTLVPASATIVRVHEWRSGVAASVRAGLAALAPTPAAGAIVVPVDTPDLPSAAVTRIARWARPEALVQASYAGVPGHPVLIGRAHWGDLSASITGDVGARPYLIAHEADSVECGDLWSGADRDTR